MPKASFGTGTKIFTQNIFWLGFEPATFCLMHRSFTISPTQQLTEADALKQPSRLIAINRGVYFKTSASVNRLTEMFFRNRLS